jgi:hypothetical protein
MYILFLPRVGLYVSFLPLLILNEALTLQFGLCCMLYKELIVMLSTGSWRAMNFSSKIKYEQKIFLPVLKRIMSDFFFYINI